MCHFHIRWSPQINVESETLYPLNQPVPFARGQEYCLESVIYNFPQIPGDKGTSRLKEEKAGQITCLQN